MSQKGEKTQEAPAAPAAPPPAAAGAAGQDLLRGLIYTHNRANANTTAAHEANATLRALVALLVEQGLVEGGEFEARRAPCCRCRSRPRSRPCL